MVAMKKLENQDSMTTDMCNDFIEEVSMMEKLRHDNIVEFIGAVRFPGNFAIVTEFCPYGSLDKAMKEHPDAFDEKMRVKCLLNTASAIQWLG